jgi:hypothetical protein
VAVRVVSAAPAGEPRRPPASLTQTHVNDLPQQIVVGPGQVLDLGDQLRPVIIANIAEGNRTALVQIADQNGFRTPSTGLRRNALACVGLSTCGLALAESERYLPDLLTALEGRLAAYGLAGDDIVIRMTGCPNG